MISWHAVVDFQLRSNHLDFPRKQICISGRPTLNLILCDSNKTSEALFSNSLHCVACLSVFLWIIFFLPMHCIAFSRGYIRFATKVPVNKNAEMLILSWYLTAATGCTTALHPYLMCSCALVKVLHIWVGLFVLYLVKFVNWVCAMFTVIVALCSVLQYRLYILRRKFSEKVEQWSITSENSRVEFCRR